MLNIQEFESGAKDPQLEYHQQPHHKHTARGTDKQQS
jgi:hypothetical protein